MRKRLGRYAAFYAGPQFAMAIMLAALWTVIGIVWLISALDEPTWMRVTLAVGGLALGAFWFVTVGVAIAYRVRRRRAQDAGESSSSTRDE